MNVERNLEIYVEENYSGQQTLLQEDQSALVKYNGGWQYRSVKPNNITGTAHTIFDYDDLDFNFLSYVELNIVNDFSDLPKVFDPYNPVSINIFVRDDLSTLKLMVQLGSVTTEVDTIIISNAYPQSDFVFSSCAYDSQNAGMSATLCIVPHDTTVVNKIAFKYGKMNPDGTVTMVGYATVDITVSEGITPSPTIVPSGIPDSWSFTAAAFSPGPVAWLTKLYIN